MNYITNIYVFIKIKRLLFKSKKKQKGNEKNLKKQKKVFQKINYKKIVKEEMIKGISK